MFPGFLRLLFLRHGLWLFVFIFLASSSARAQTNEYRAYWVDAFHPGFRSSAEVTTLMNTLRAANCNAVIPEIRKRTDAYYNGSPYEPKATDISPPTFDPLADLIAKGHDTNGGQQRLEIHAWLVTYKTSGTQPTAWMHKNYSGATSTSEYDPGHPLVQERIYNVSMDIVSRYDIDGLNYDYVRYPENTALGPTLWGYNDVTVARFNTRFGRTGIPVPEDPQWNQFRRDQVTSLVRKIYLNVMAIKPWVKISADTITWNPSPSSPAEFTNSARAYNDVLQDWRGWMEEGIIDLNIPMNYYRHGALNYAQDYMNWMNFAKDHQYGRHTIIGPGVYLNFATNVITQMRLTREPSPNGNFARGVCGYSYAVPVTNSSVSAAQLFQALSQPSAYDTNPVPIFAERATIPEMPWKTTPIKGHAKGFIYGGAVTNPLDGATVTIIGPVNRIQTNDATAFYGFVDLPPGTYTVTASFPGYFSASTNVTINIGNVASRDFILNVQSLPVIVTHPQSQAVYSGSPVNFSVSASSTEPIFYQWRFGGTNLNAANSSALTIDLALTNQAGNYDVVITNSFGAVTSQVATLSVTVSSNTRLIPLWNLPVGSRSYITTNSTERGLAHNPVTDRLLLVNRAGSGQVVVLNSTNGAELHTLNLGSGIISGGTFAMLMIGAADDGAVYVGNLTLNASTNAFKLYRWVNDNSNTVPTVAFSGDPAPGNVQRWGDTIDVRGSGTNTQVIIGSRSGTNAIIFTTIDGINFSNTFVSIPGITGGGLGVAFGEGNTFWGKANGNVPLRQFSFDLSNGTGAVLRSHGNPEIPNSVAAIGVSTLLNLVAGIALDTPDHLRLYDLTTNNGAPILIETNSFLTDNDNANGTGSVDFYGDRVFALDSNNGILAMRILPLPVQFDAIAKMANQQTRLQMSGGRGMFLIQRTTDFVNWSPLFNVTNTNGVFEFTDPETNVSSRFYRATPKP